VYLKNFPRVAPTTLAALLGALLFLQPLRGADLGTGPEEEAGPQAWQERQRHRYGQSGTVTGKVVTSDGSPVPGALVKILELNSKVTADQAGRFSFTDLPRQELTFTAEAPGFFPSTPVKLDLINKAEFELAITLVEKLPVTQSVVVTTGTGTEYVAVDAPVRTETITASRIERNVSRTLSEALTTTVPGVRVEYTCQNCGAPMIRLNGLEGAYTQILEDGLPTMSNLAMVYAVDQIPAEFFESIEVVKGGASALYGPNAVAGVINLIRKEPNYNLFQVDSQAGWHHGRPEESLGLAAQSNKLPAGFAADLHFRALKRTPIDRDNDGFTELPKRDLKGATGALYRRFLNGTARLTLGGSVFSEFRRGGENNFRVRPDQTSLTEMADCTRSSGLLRWNHTVSASTVYTLSAALSYLGRSSYYGSDFDPNAYGLTGNPVLVADAQLGHQTGKHTWLGGWQFQREQVRDNILAYHRAYNRVFRNSGGYLQDEYRLGHGAVLVAGMRADKSNLLDHWVVSPRGNLRVGIRDKWRWRFGVSSGFRAPVIFDEDLHVAQVGGAGMVLENAPGLKEEKSVSITSSLDYVGTVRGLPFQAGLTFFSTWLRDQHVLKEVLESSGEFRKLLRINGGGSQVRGVEFNLDWRLLPRIGVRGGGTLQTARYDKPEPQFSSRRFLRTPNRYGFGGLDLSLPKGFSLLTTVNLTGSMLVPHYAGYIPEDRLETSKTFKVWDLVVDRTFALRKNDRTKIRLYMRASNLLDDFQPDLDRGPLRDSSYFYGPGNMRMVVVGMTFTLR